jgi:hypothetical protein
MVSYGQCVITLWQESGCGVSLNKRILLCVATFGLMLGAFNSLASAAIVTEFFKLTRTDFPLPGTTYIPGFVWLKLTANDADLGKVTFDAKINPNLPDAYKGKGMFSEFGFDVASPLSDLVVEGLPSGWICSTSHKGSLDGFGKFNVVADTGQGGNQLAVPELTFTVTGLAGDDAKDWINDFCFATPSSGGQGSGHFAAHLIGLGSCTGYVGVDVQIDDSSSSTPEPTALVTWSLLGAVAAGYGWRRRCGRKSRS